MKRVLIAASAFVLLLYACNKDKYQTKPQISIKSLSTDVVPLNGSLTVTLSYTDKEGDLTDSIFIRKVRTNKRVLATIRDSFGYKMPDFPKNSKGEIEVVLDFQNILSAINPVIPGTNPPKNEPDTLLLKFAVRDAGKHVSDTVVTSKVVVIR